MQYPTKSILLAGLLAFSLLSCKKDDDGSSTPDSSYDIPTTYNFANVNYSGQTDRLNQLSEMTTYMKTGNTAGTVLDAQVLKDMYANENGNGNGNFSFSSSKQLKGKTFELDQALFEQYMDIIATASASAIPGSNGQAGVVVSNDGTKNYLFDANGIEYTQLIEKGLMAATFYYQSSTFYLSDDQIGATVDNETVENGEGTPMERHWDEAFGYFGAPIDFPTNTDDARFHAKYCNSRDALLGTNAKLMGAFLKGRAAISNKDNDTKNEARDEVRQYWELVIAATAVHYLNGGMSNFTDDAIRNHELSEAIAFVGALKYNSEKTITNTEINNLLNTIGSNLYEVSMADLAATRNELSTIFSLESVKETL